MKYKTHSVKVGKEIIGGNAPVLIQSMATVPTTNVEEVVRQAIEIHKSGASLVRLTVQGTKEADALPEIKKQLQSKGYNFPISADIHFSYKTAYAAAEIVEKVRINPGNFVKHRETDSFEEGRERFKERFIPLLNICKQRNVALRIGVNHGSLSNRITERYGDTPKGIVASCLEFLEICEIEEFKDVVISIKSSNVVVMISAVRLLVEEMQKRTMSFPLHLGVTEAGEGEDARIKSSVGIGTLLNQNIGDTIRVSLTEPPENEPNVARKIIAYTHRDKNDANLRFVSNSRQIQTIKGFNDDTFAKVIVDLRKIKETSPEILGHIQGKKKIRACDFVIVEGYREDFPKSLQQIVPKENYDGQGYPLLEIRDWSAIQNTHNSLHFVRCTKDTQHLVANLKNTEQVVLIYETRLDAVAFEDIISFYKQLEISNLYLPVVLSSISPLSSKEDFQIVAATTLGYSFIDRMASGILLQNIQLPMPVVLDTAFGILQATRVRTTKTEFISCPGCGRTLFSLMEVTEKVKKHFSHLNHLKIAVMGCIVNGPGEMGDADYGYVGAGSGKISLYKGMEVQKKNIPSEEAIEILTNLIKEHGDWKDIEAV